MGTVLVCWIFLLPGYAVAAAGEHRRTAAPEHDVPSIDGTIYSPRYPGCDFGQPLTTWNFAPVSHLVVIKFMDFDIPQCSAGEMELTVAGESQVFCGETRPPNVIWGAKMSITLRTISKDCGRGIVISHTYPRLVLHLASPIVVNDKALVALDVPNLPDEISGSCHRITASGKKSFKFTSLPHLMSEHFDTSGLVKYSVSCQLKVSQTREYIGRIEARLNVAVQDDFRILPSLDILETEGCILHKKDLNITVQHLFVYPATYHVYLVIDPSQVTTRTIEYTNDLMDRRPSMETILKLSWFFELGPGKYNATLIAENDVSTRNQTFTLNICEPLTSIHILPLQYIDLAPSEFTVKVQIPKGSPAEIDISLRNKQDNKNSATARTFCNNPQKCQEVSIQMSVPFEGVFDIIATAKNELGEVTSTIGPVESFPLVQDVFVTSSFPINTTSPGIYFVFYKIPSNRGTFEIKLSASGEVFTTEKLSTHISFIEAEQTLLNLKIPFNPTTYNVHKHSHLIIKPGKYEIAAKVETENRKQSLTAKTNIEVFSALVEICLTGVKIRDGRKGGFLMQSFDGKAPILLTADVELKCDIKDGEEIEYKWKIYKATALSETPDLRNKINVDDLKTDTFELYLEPWKIKPGLYLIELLIHHKDKFGDVISQVDDFISVEIPKSKLKAQICGGVKREIGQNTTEIEFNAVCSGNRHLSEIKYEWFCALSKEDLPVEKRIGMFQKKGACFKQKPLFVGENQKFPLNRENITRRGGFFVRVFLSVEGSEDEFTDQEIVLLPHLAPNILLKCLANCEIEVEPEHAISVLALCDSCFEFEWFYDGKSYCDRPFCTIEEEDLPRSGTVTLQAVGFDDHDRNATVSMERLITNPLQMKFNVHPEEPIPNKSKATFSYESNETVLVSFSVGKIPGGPFTLLQYGYSQIVSDVFISTMFPYVILNLEACTLNGICHTEERNVRVDLSDDTEQNLDSTEWEINLEKAVKAGNTQQVVKNALAISEVSKMQNEVVCCSQIRKKDVFDYGLKSPLVSTESAKQSLDLIRLGITSSRLTLSEQSNLVKRLSNISSVIRHDEDISPFMLDSVVGNSIHLASTIFESAKETKIYSNSNQRALTNVLAEISWDNMRERYTPGVRTYSSEAVTASMGRYWRDDRMLVTDSDVAVEVESSNDKDKEFSDIMVFRFKSSKTNFETKTEAPDEVVGMAFISSRKIFGEAKPRTEQFTPDKPVKFGLKTHEPEYSIDELNVVKDDLEEMSRFSGADQMQSNSTSNGSTLNLWVGRRAIIVQGQKEPVLLKISIILSNVSKENIQELGYVRLKLEELNDDFPLTKSISPTDLTDRAFTWVVTVREGDSFFNLTIQIRSPFPVHFVKVLPHAFRCSFWDDDGNDWSSRGCTVAPETRIDGWARCECDLQQVISSRSMTSRSAMKLFSSRLIIYPNKIDLSKLTDGATSLGTNGTQTVNLTQVIDNFKREVNENPIIVVTVISMYVVFTFALIFARIKDSRDMRMPPYMEVCDNIPNERYRYLVTVFTGSRRRAGPSSTVAIKLIGNIGSVVHLLQKLDEEKVLLQGSVVTFLVTAHSCLGDIDMVRIWHCNDGDSPEWYLDRLVVRDYEANECWFFLVNTWLSDYHMGECQIDITVKAASISQLHSFHSLFTIKSQNYLKDRHMWYSMFAMRPWSIYDMTRAQRVACCMLLIFMLMLTSLMFYGSDSEFVVDLGFYSFKWSNIAIGMESGILCFPVTYIVTMIFRASRDRYHDYDSHDATSVIFKPVQKRKFPSESDSTSYFTCDENDKKKSLNGRKLSKKSHQKDLVAVSAVEYQAAPFLSKSTSSPYFSCEEELHRSDIYNAKKLMTSSQERKNRKIARGTRPEKSIPRGTKYKKILQDKYKQNETKISNKDRSLMGLHRSTDMMSQLSQTQSIGSSSYLRQDPVSSSARIYSRLALYKERLQRRDQNISKLRLSESKDHHDIQSSTFHNSEQGFFESHERKDLLPSSGIYGTPFLPGDMKGLGRRPHPAIKAGVTVMDVDPGSIDYKPLPWFFIYFGWLIVFSVVVTCSTLSILYGMTYGVHISRQWLVSLLTGVIQSIFVLEPMKAIMLAYFVVANHPRHDITDWIPPLRNEVLPRKHKNSSKVIRMLRKERESNPVYKIPDIEKVKRDSVDHMMNRVKKRRLKDMSVHLVYLLFLCVIAFGLHDNRIFYFKQSLTNMFKVNTKAWNSINTRENVYDWFQGPVIDTLYGGYSSYFTDGQLLVIAPPTLRQQRIAKSKPCLHGSFVPYFNLPTCKFGSETEDMGRFSAKWNKFSDDENLKHFEKRKSPWVYQSGDPWSLPFLGEHDNYHLGGFVAQLSSDKNNATKMIVYLRRNNWIDHRTRIVMLETVLYNSAVRFYCVVTMAFEIPNTGKIHSSLQLMVMKSHYVATTLDYVIYLSLFALLGMVFYFVYNIVSLVRETGIAYLSDVWNVLETLTLLTSVAAIVTYLSKAMYTDLALYATKTGGENLFLFYTAACLDYTLTCLFGYCMFFTTLRTVALMEGHPHFRLSHATMQIVRIDLAGHLVCLLIGYLAFCHSGLIMFHDMLDFSSKLRATQSIVAYSAGAYMNNLLANHPMHGGIFLLIFLLLYVKLFVNFYAVILENAFRESKLLLRNIKRGDFVTLRRKQIRSLFAIEGRKKAEQEAKEKKEREEKEKKILLDLLKLKMENGRKGRKSSWKQRSDKQTEKREFNEHNRRKDDYR